MASKIISQIDFIEYLAKLPAEGETLLLVQQKPVNKDGKPVLHNDGTPKYTGCLRCQPKSSLKQPCTSTQVVSLLTAFKVASYLPHLPTASMCSF